MRHPIDLDRMRAAMKASRFSSYNHLATTAGLAHTTLSRLFKHEIEARRRSGIGQPGTVQTDTLRRLADTLQVPADWLTGETDALPLVPKHGLLSIKAPDDTEDVTEAKVRLSHLLTSVDEAVRRDLAMWFEDDAEAVYRSWGWVLLEVAGELASPVTWRVCGVVPRDAHPGVYLQGAPRWDTASIDWLEQMLAPWFDGDALLNARVLHDILAAIVESADRPWASRQTDRDMLQALEEYDAASTRP